MINLKKVIAGVMASTIMFAAVGCSMVEKTEEGIRKTVVAKVYDEKITLGEVDDNLGLVLDQVKSYYGEDYKNNEDAMAYLTQKRLEMVDTLINDVIFKVKAEELGILPTDEELTTNANEELEKIKSSFDDEETYKSALAATGFTEEQFIEELKLSNISTVVYEASTKDVTVTDEDVKKYYDENPNEYTENTNRINPAHILVEDEATANEIIEKLNNGADFAELAKEYGTDGTSESGGELGWIEYDSQEIDPTFLKAAIEVNKGEYTPAPVKTSFGYHVIKCLDKEEYPVQPFDSVKEEVYETVLDNAKYEKWQETLKQWQDDADIKLYEDRLEE